MRSWPLHSQMFHHVAAKHLLILLTFIEKKLLLQQLFTCTPDISFAEKMPKISLHRPSFPQNRHPLIIHWMDGLLMLVSWVNNGVISTYFSCRKISFSSQDIVAQLVAMLDGRKHAASVVGSNPTPWTIFQQAVSKDHVYDLSELKIKPKTVIEADVSPP